MAKGSEYPKVQLLDDLNAPFSPQVSLDSIYADGDESKKQSLNLIYKKEANNKNAATLDASAFSEIKIALNIDIPTSGTTNEHKLLCDEYNLNELLTAWYEKAYLGTVNRDYIVYCGLTPNANFNVTEMESLKPDAAKMYPVADYNTTNFSSSNNPKKAILKPSAEYIWFYVEPINESDNDAQIEFSFYGFSDDDAPQEIEVKRVAGSNLYLSTGTMGIDYGFNSNQIGGDGLAYNVFAKYILK